MSSNPETNLIPKLRFPQFITAWENKCLGDIAFFSKGKGISKNDVSKDGKILAIRYGELYTRYSEIIKNVHSKTDINPTNLKFGKTNDVIIPASGESRIDIATASCLLIDNVAIGGDINIISSKTNGIFLSCYLNSAKRLDIAKLAQGNSVVHLYSSQLKVLKVNLPGLIEQEKIANFITLTTDKIARMQKEVELLKEYRAGLIQLIFTQKIKFKDKNKNEYPSWAEKRLDEIILKSTKKNKQLVYKLVQSVSNSKGFINQTELFKDHVIASKDLSNYFIIDKGTFAYNPSRINVGSLAYKNDDNTSVVSPLYVCFRAINDYVLDEYLFCWFDSMDFKKQMNNSFEGIVRNTLGYESLKKIVIKLPSLEEQLKIARFLGSINDKIKNSQISINNIKQYKKILLKEMFV